MLPDYKAIANSIIENTINKEPAEATEIMLLAVQDNDLSLAIIENPRWLEWTAKFKSFRGTPEHTAIVERLRANQANRAVAKAFKRIRDITAIDGKSLVERAGKTCEEVGETMGAILSYTNAPGSGYKNKTLDDVIEENADTFICVLSVLAHAAPEMSLEQFMDVVNIKMDKWESKVKGQG